MKNLFFTILIIGLFNSEKVSSQPNFDCGTILAENVNNFTVPTEGYYKPNRTDTLNGVALPEDAVLPVLVVFVQFKNEASDPRHTWDTNSAPIYLDSLISRTKKTTGNWWNFYNPETEVISSHWMEISRGKLHVISPQGAFSVVLSQEASYYAAFGTGADTVINEEIWKSLHSQGLRDWRDYDRWRQDYLGFFHFEPAGQADSVVDMIYKVHKSRNTGGLADFAGYSTLSYYNSAIRYLADTSNQIRINYSGGVAGSGITVSFRGQLAQYLGTMGHEHGHYTFSPSGHALHLTPPSRPMGLRVLSCDSLPESGGYKLIKIRWNHNQEPDMKRVVEGDTVKRYKIYRSMTESLSEVPPDALAFSENQYLNIAQKDISPGDLPEFTDTLISICNSTNSTQTWYPFPVRYRVQAVDKYEDASVLSDFANTRAWRIVSQNGGYEEEGRPLPTENLSIPEKFDLKQNYPNPFNPVTNIQYDLPFDNFVSIKIYDILGKEVATLVNETKTAGRYIISFNASNHASGIYYYKIKAGNFEQVRKMIILK